MVNKFYVGIIAYNEEKNIGNVIKDVLGCEIVNEVIVVDDASTDGTADIVTTFPDVKYARNETNRGIGGTEKRLFDEFLLHSVNDDDMLAIMHGDGQMRVEELDLFHETLLSTDADVVLGSRLLGRKNFLDEKRRPLWKIMGDLFACTLENIAFDTRLSSYGSAFRAWKRSALKSIKYNECSSRVTFEIEVIASARFHNLKMREIPIQTVWSDFGFNSNIVKYAFDVFNCMMKYGSRIWIQKAKNLFPRKELPANSD